MTLVTASVSVEITKTIAKQEGKIFHFILFFRSSSAPTAGTFGEAIADQIQTQQRKTLHQRNEMEVPKKNPLKRPQYLSLSKQL